jgi:hypothetical protein
MRMHCWKQYQCTHTYLSEEVEVEHLVGNMEEGWMVMGAHSAGNMEEGWMVMGAHSAGNMEEGWMVNHILVMGEHSANMLVEVVAKLQGVQGSQEMAMV